MKITHSVLDEIISVKKEEVALQKTILPLAIIKSNSTHNAHVFLHALKNPHRSIAIIAEHKNASPSLGQISKGDVLDQTIHAYTKARVDAISILTERAFFSGSPRHLTRAKEITSTPLLRKDFIFDSYQIHESKHLGADAILLITSLFEPNELRELYLLAVDIGLDVLVETHTTEEIKTAIDIGAEIIGVNSRDLKTFHEDLGKSLTLIHDLPKNIISVAESSIHSSFDRKRAQNSHANAMLIGTYLMKSQDKALAIDKLFDQSK